MDLRVKDEHEEEFMQSDDEIAMKVVANEASTLLSVVTTGKAPIKRFGSQETSECSDRPSFALRSGLVVDSHRKEGGQAWRDQRLRPERVLQEAPQLRRCTSHRCFIQNMTICRVAHRHGSHLGSNRQPSHFDACTQNSSPSSCRVHTRRGIS